MSQTSNKISPAASRVPMLYAAYFVYFCCGLTQCFESVFLPEFKSWFQLDFEQQMYTMFAKNIPFLLAGGIGLILHRIGYKTSFVLALLFFSAGTALLVPGLAQRQYALVLAGFLLVGIGFNFEIVAGNPLLSALGPPETASSRLNLGNALGAVAQIIAPASLSLIIPATANTLESRVPWIERLLLVLAGALFMIALAVAWIRNPSISPAGAKLRNDPRRTRRSLPSRVYFGLAAITLALGAEAALFGFYRNYLEDPGIAALTPAVSQRLFTLYFTLFAAGRLTASWMQRCIAPAAHLRMSLVGALVFLCGAMFAKGTLAIVLMTGIGFWIATFYPTLYSLATDGLGDLTAQASGLLTMGFLGAAVFPVLQGRLADSIGLRGSYGAAIVAYLFVALCAGRSRSLSDDPRATL